jgi:hypothetical protein
MSLFFLGVLEKLRSYGFGIKAASHVVMALVAQNADDLSGERLVKDADYCLAIAAVSLSDSSVFDVLAGAPADLLDIADERAALFGF